MAASVSSPSIPNCNKNVSDFNIMTVSELKSTLKYGNNCGLLLDIDETLSATNIAWFTRMIDLFGNEEPDLTAVELSRKYHLAQNVPFWAKNKAAAEWMQQQRDSPEAQKHLPLIEGALDGVKELQKELQTLDAFKDHMSSSDKNHTIIGYCTVRPENVGSATVEWLREHKFPALPLVLKPDIVPFEKGNQWKGDVLKELWPNVIGIVDDNPKVAIAVGKEYPGFLFLFGHYECKPEYNHAIPCPTWTSVIQNFNIINNAKKLL